MTTVTSGSHLYVTNPTVETNDFILSGGEISVYNGGITSNTVVSGGGLLYIATNGLDIGATLVGGEEPSAGLRPTPPSSSPALSSPS